MRRTHENVLAEMLEKVLAYNISGDHPDAEEAFRATRGPTGTSLKDRTHNVVFPKHCSTAHSPGDGMKALINRRQRCNPSLPFRRDASSAALQPGLVGASFLAPAQAPAPVGWHERRGAIAGSQLWFRPQGRLLPPQAPHRPEFRLFPNPACSMRSPEAWSRLLLQAFSATAALRTITSLYLRNSSISACAGRAWSNILFASLNPPGAAVSISRFSSGADVFS